MDGLRAAAMVMVMICGWVMIGLRLVSCADVHGYALEVVWFGRGTSVCFKLEVEL